MEEIEVNKYQADWIINELHSVCRECRDGKLSLIELAEKCLTLDDILEYKPKNNKNKGGAK